VIAVTPVIAWFRRERNRAYIYRGLVGTAPVLEAYGLVSDSKVALILGAAAAWLGVGLASANTTTEAKD
jgi:hypothetical protein